MNLTQSTSIFFNMLVTSSLLTGELNDSVTNIRLPYYVIPLHYNVDIIHLYTEKHEYYLEIMLSPREGFDRFTFKGETSTTINILQSTRHIKMHSQNLIIVREKVTLITNKGIIYVVDKHRYNYETMKLVFFLPNILPGLYTFKIEFFGHIVKKHEQSFSKTFYKRNSVALLIAPHIQAEVRQLFPCWDEPYLKATFNISVNHHRNFTVLSNMPIRLRPYSNDLLWTYFEITPLMSTFQIAIVVTNYRRIKIDENIFLWCEKCSEYSQALDFEFAKRIIKDITLHLKSQFNGINIPKMDHIAVPNFLQDGLSKWGLIFHTEANLIYDKQTDSIMRKIEVARLIASKIAYQWFSNVISLTWWSYFWLHDCLAILFGEEAVVEIFSDSQIKDFFIVQSQYESLHLDSYYDMNPKQITNLSEIDSIFSFPRYIKALIVLRMLQSTITDEAFRNNILIYINRSLFDSIIYDEFWYKDFWQENVAKLYSCKISLHEFLTWIQYRHYPVLKWRKRENLEAKLLQLRYNTTRLWWIPTNLREISILHTNLKVCVTPNVTFINIFFPENEWIYNWTVNIELAGYYRVNYNSENWNMIIKHLISNARNYEGINAINRAKIVDDAFHLMMEGQINVSIFWNLTQYLSEELNYVAWYPMIKIFEYMSSMFPFSHKEYNFVNIKEKFRNLLTVPMKTLGFAELTKELPENDLRECLRQEILKWACMLEHLECTKNAAKKLEANLQNPELYPVSSEWKHWTYCRGLILCYERDDDYYMWFKARDTWLRKPAPDLLPYLACCESNWIITKQLANLFLIRFTQNKMENITIIRSYINIFHSIVSKHVNTYSILQQILLNLEKIKPKEINILTALTDIINHVYSTAILSQIPYELKNVSYISGNQLSRIEHKIQIRLAEINRHIEHFQFINVP